jgi:hypothetical protein
MCVTNWDSVNPAYRKNVLIHCWPTLVLPPGLYTEISISQSVRWRSDFAMHTTGYPVRVRSGSSARCNPALFSVSNCGLIARASKMQFCLVPRDLHQLVPSLNKRRFNELTNRQTNERLWNMYGRWATLKGSLCNGFLPIYNDCFNH